MKIKNLFGKNEKNSNSNSSKDKSQPKNETISEETTFEKLMNVKPNEISHKFSFGEVYANELAKSEIEKDKPNFPIGSIIVREKNKTATSETPETVIAMVKREVGFSDKTNDWEFFTFQGSDLQMQKRETVGNCADCHSKAKQTDWVFREYLK